jgi:hypothetical protein
MISPRGVVYRLLLDPLRREWLTRSEALFASEEWGWSTDASNAYTFPTHDGAERKVTELEQSGMPHPLVAMVKHEARQEAAAPA